MSVAHNTFCYVVVLPICNKRCLILRVLTWAAVEKDTARPFLVSFPVAREAGGGTSEHFGLNDSTNVDEDVVVFSSVTGGTIVLSSAFSGWVTCFPSLSGSLGSDLTVVFA